MAAGERFSNRVLWQFISCTGVLRPKELIEIELKRQKDRIESGLLYYSIRRSTTGERLKAERNVTGAQIEFIQKLSTFLGLDEVQAYDLFCSFLVYDYRGSQKNLQQVFNSERHSQALILKIRDFYFTERLYLLRCMKEVLCYWSDQQHPYKDEYASFLNSLLEKNQLIDKILESYDNLCDVVFPSWETHGNLMNEKQALLWAQQNLKEQCELLEILLLYYKDFQHETVKYIVLAEKFKKQGFGRRQLYKHVLDETAEMLLRRISYIQILVLIEGMDFETLQSCNRSKCFLEHPLLKDKASFKKLDKVFTGLGSSPSHGPVLLAWAVMRHVYLEEEDAQVTRKLGNSALQLSVFGYLTQLLTADPFNGKTPIALVAKYFLYSMLFTVTSVFDEESLGDLEAIFGVSASLLKQPVVVRDFWSKGVEDGLGTLYQSALNQFPLEFSPLIQMSTSLASADKGSAQKVMIRLQQLPVYTEFLDRNSSQDLQETSDSLVWQLSRDKHPYTTGIFSIPHRTFGQLLPQQAKGSPIIQWEYTYNGWQLLMCEIHELLHQVSQGAGMVSPDQISRVTEVMLLVKAVLTSDPDAVDQFADIIKQCYQLLHRFSVLSPPPLQLIAASLECITCDVARHPKQVWHCMKQTGLMPYLTENLDNFDEVLSGQGLSAGIYGSILAGFECTRGEYLLTQAFLSFMSTMVQPLSHSDEEDQLMAPMLFVLREVFPAFHKWRYYNMAHREVIGQKCLEFFHKILNFIAMGKKKEQTRINLQRVCAYSLLFTEAGRSLLEIISTGADVIEQALAQQGSTTEGGGVELIQLIQLAFSVLNRLMLLKSPDLPISPVEHALASQPANRQSQHIIATVAQYIYHRHNPRLPTIAMLLLKRLAMVSPMSILACLGNDAEPIRDMFLTRLQALTEDLLLKVAILNLLSVCVETQPGLTEVFLNIQPTEGKKDLSLGKSSCLQTLLNLMDEKKQSSYQCPPDLLCACMEFVHSLWAGLRDTAMSVLRAKSSFWPSVCAPLQQELPSLDVTDEEDAKMLHCDIKTTSFVFKILAQEIYVIPSTLLDGNLKKALKRMSKENRLNFWSQYICVCMKHEGMQEKEVDPISLSDNPTLQLLLAWKNFLITAANLEIAELEFTDALKEQILQDLLSGLQAQASNTSSILCMKLSSVASALYLTVIKSWVSSIQQLTGVLQQLKFVLTLTSSGAQTTLPAVQIGLLGAVTVVMQHLKQAADAAVEVETISDLLPIVCTILQQSTRQLVPKGLHGNKKGANIPPETNSNMDAMVKLQVVAVCLLEELILQTDTADSWLPLLKEHCILPALLNSVEPWIKARQGVTYIQAVFLLLATVSKSEKGAEALSLSGLTAHTCLPVATLYGSGEMVPRCSAPTKLNKKGKSIPSESQSWHIVYCTSIEMYASLLARLRYSFLKDALDFVGVHQERLQQSLEYARMSLFESAMYEAEKSCTLIYQLSFFARDWRLHLPDVLKKLLTSLIYMSQTFISLLIRPRYLQHVLERQTGAERSQGNKMPSMSPIPPLIHQTSTEDIGQPTAQLINTQQRMLAILGTSLSALRQFTPDLCEIMLDQSMDISEYDPFLNIGFSPPSVDQDNSPTFGTFLSCVNVCMTLLNKVDPRVSPHKASDNGIGLVISKSLIIFVMESALYLLMSQATRYLKDPSLSARDKQLLKRELGTELNSFLMGMQRYTRRGGPASPSNSGLLVAPRAQSPGGATLTRSSSQVEFTSSQEVAYFKLVQDFVKKVLR